MNKMLLCAALVWLALPAVATQPTTLENLTILSGKTYDGVTVTEVRPDGVSIMHSAGTARIPYEDLPADLREKLGGFDDVEAAKWREKDSRKRAARNRAIDAAERDTERRRELDQRAKARLKASTPASLEIVQALEDGALCRIRLFVMETRHKIETNAFGEKTRIPYKVPVLGPSAEELVHVSGIAQQVVDGDTIVRSVLRLSKPYVYTNTLGARTTVRAYEALSVSEGKALDR